MDPRSDHSKSPTIVQHSRRSQLDLLMTIQHGRERLPDLFVNDENIHPGVNIVWFLSRLLISDTPDQSVRGRLVGSRGRSEVLEQ